MMEAMAQPRKAGGFAVLVVEDDALLRAEAVDLCIEAGFETYDARNADQAIALLERHPEIHVLFTDIEMEGSMDGLRLAHAVREHWPPVAILVTSGRRNVAKEELPLNGLFFAKPYPPDDIVRALSAIAGEIAA